MAKTDDVNKALTTGQNGSLAPQDRLESLIERADVKKRFDEVLGNKRAAFISSVIAAVKGNSALGSCPPMSIISSAMIAATLDLPINPSLGFAHIVPYKDNGQPVAQFQLGWKGFVQLGIRTGAYQTMNVSEIYADEIDTWNPIKGDLKLKPMEEWKERYAGNGRIVGYCAYIRMMNGFEKFLFMTYEQVEAHAKKYSKTYQMNKGQWVKNFDAMALKTVIKLLLSKFGMLSVDYQMQKALKVDQAASLDLDGETITYPDATIGDAQEPDPEEGA